MWSLSISVSKTDFSSIRIVQFEFASNSQGTYPGRMLVQLVQTVLLQDHVTIHSANHPPWQDQHRRDWLAQPSHVQHSCLNPKEDFDVLTPNVHADPLSILSCALYCPTGPNTSSSSPSLTWWSQHLIDHELFSSMQSKWVNSIETENSYAEELLMNLWFKFLCDICFELCLF